MSDSTRLVAIESGMVDCQSGEVRGERPGRLTKTERRVLRFLVDRPDQPISRELLLEKVWGYAQRSSSRTVYATMRRIREKIERVPEEPRHLLTIGRAGYAFAPLRAEHDAEPRPHPWMWRVPLDPFVGRQGSLAALRGWFVGTDGAPVMELVGPPGVGKTRVALEFAVAQASEAPAGVHVVEAASAQGTSDVLAAVADTLGMPSSHDDRLVLRVRRALVGRGRGLMVLDGTDHLDDLAELLGALKGEPLRILVVAREPRVGGAVLRLGPLGQDGDAGEGDRLFVTRVRSRWPRWAPSAEDHDAIKRIVAHFGGVPLGIELAAHAATVLSPRALADRLSLDDSGVDALVDGIRWSWERLAPVDQRTLAALAVFPVDFDVAAAEAVCVDPHVAASLARLAERALLVVHDDPSGRRLRLPSAVRAYLADSADRAPSQSVITRMVAHFAQLGTDASLDALMRHGTAEAYRRLQRELPNLLAAHLADEGLQGARAARAAIAWLLFSGLSERALALMNQRLATMAEEMFAQTVWFHRIRGEAHRRLGRLDEARADLQHALRLARESAPDRVGSVVHSIGVLEQVHGVPDDAEAAFSEALREHARTGDAFRRALTLSEQGTLRLRRGRHDEAISLFKDALVIMRVHDARTAEVIVLGNLGVAQLKVGQYEASESSLLQALALSKALGSHRFEVGNTSNLGLLYATKGDLERAEEHYVDVLRRTRDVGDELEASVTRIQLGLLALRKAELARARSLLDKGTQGLADLEIPYLKATAKLAQCALCRREGDLARARVRLQEADALVELGDCGDLRPWCAAEAGLLECASGSEERARGLLDEARRLARDVELSVDCDAHWAIASLADELRATEDDPGGQRRR